MTERLKSITWIGPRRYEVQLLAQSGQSIRFEFQVGSGKFEVLQAPHEFYEYFGTNLPPRLLLDAIMKFHRAQQLELP